MNGCGIVVNCQRDGKEMEESQVDKLFEATRAAGASDICLVSVTYVHT